LWNTLAEPDVAISPVNPSIQVAVAHDCRFSNGGAADISYAWTHDGGDHRHHAPVPGQITQLLADYEHRREPLPLAAEHTIRDWLAAGWSPGIH
jgi:hypothetical protein